MSNITILRGHCFAPFFEQSSFPSSEGYIPGRYCAEVGGVSCCLPCPASDWIYPEDFSNKTQSIGILNAIGLALVVFTLISFAILPKEKTRRHYLNVGLLLGIASLELGFVVPLGAQPEQCFNEITPNDMHSNMVCAWSGAFAVAGGAAVTTWIFVRCLSMHLQVCWNIIPGTYFFLAAQVFSWGIAGVLLTTCLVVTGVSFRFGDFCLVNEHKAAASLWGPLLGFVGIIMILQITTFFFVLKVYLQKYREEGRNNNNNLPDSFPASLTPSDTTSRRRREVYKRITKVLQLQWRSLMIAGLVLLIIVLLSVVFIVVDSETLAATHNANLTLPWEICLVQTQGDAAACLKYVHGLAPSEALLMATLVILSLTGVAAYLILNPLAVLGAWRDFIQDKRRAKPSPSTSPENPTEMIGFQEVQRQTKSMPPPRSVGSRLSRIPDALRSSHSGARDTSPSLRSDSFDFLNRDDLEKDSPDPTGRRSSIGQPARSSMALENNLDWEERHSFAALHRDKVMTETHNEVWGK